MGGDAELIKGPGPGPASLQAASPPEEGEAPVAEAAPPSPEDLIGVLLALFSVGDFGKKLYSVLCRDIATDGQPQPFYRSEQLEAKHTPRGACWREIRGRRAAPKEDWPQPPIGRRLGVSGQCLDGARPAPPPKGAGRRGEGRGQCAELCGCRYCHRPQRPRRELQWAWHAGAAGWSGLEHLGRKLVWRTRKAVHL